MARKIDDVLTKFREIIGPKASKNDRAILECVKCEGLYSTSAQNERKKIEKWVCGRCILSKPKSNETKERMSEAALEPNSRSERSRRQRGNKNSFFGKKHSQKTLSKMRGRKWSAEAKERFSKQRALEIANGLQTAITKGNKCWYRSIKTNQYNFADSGYELVRMKFLDNQQDVKSWTKKHGIVLLWGPEQRRYIPDFFIELQDGRVILEEIKGWVQDPEEFNYKNNVAEEYCKSQNIKFQIIFKNNLEQLEP